MPQLPTLDINSEFSNDQVIVEYQQLRRELIAAQASWERTHNLLVVSAGTLLAVAYKFDEPHLVLGVPFLCICATALIASPWRRIFQIATYIRFRVEPRTAMKWEHALSNLRSTDQEELYSELKPLQRVKRRLGKELPKYWIGNTDFSDESAFVYTLIATYSFSLIVYSAVRDSSTESEPHSWLVTPGALIVGAVFNFTMLFWRHKSFSDMKSLSEGMQI